jgi:hypothetical protein
MRPKMKRIITVFLVISGLISLNLHAELHVNPFTSYNKQIEFIEKQLDKADEKQKAAIRERLENVKKQKEKAVNQRKKPYLRKLKNLKKYLAEAKSDSKKTSLQNRIDEFQGKIDRIDAYARGESKYDVDKKKIDQKIKKKTSM